MATDDPDYDCMGNDLRQREAERQRERFLEDLRRREAKGFPDVDLSKPPPGPPNPPEPPDDRPVA